MLIEWSIEKKRGNLRPVLTYKTSLEEHEKALALPPVSITSTIPEPPEAWQDYCYPGLFERVPTIWIADKFYNLEAPSHKGHSWTKTLMLPWREDNNYPEVEASFMALREAVEAELARACASAPLRLEHSLHTSKTAKTVLAPAILGERFLALARRG